MVTKRTKARRGRGEGSVFQLPDGTWAAQVSVSIAGQPRRRPSVYGATKTEVLERVAGLRARLGGSTEPSEQPLSQYLPWWLDNLKNVKQSTLHSYRQNTLRHILPYLGHFPMNRLSAFHVTDWLATLERQGMSPRLRQLCHAILRRALNIAVQDYQLLPANPARVRGPRVERTPMHVWDTEQAQRFLSFHASDRLQPLIHLALYSCARQAEILGLQTPDADLRNGMLYIRRQLLEFQGNIQGFGSLKTKSGVRSIPLDDEICTMLRRHRARLLQEGLAASEWIFPTRAGTPYLKSNLLRRFHQMCREAGVPRIRFHDLRHTGASLLLKAGVHPKVVQERLGHASIELTLNTYSHVLPSMQADASKALGGLLSQAAPPAANEDRAR
jgi:integrase